MIILPTKKKLNFNKFEINFVNINTTITVGYKLVNENSYIFSIFTICKNKTKSQKKKIT